MIGGIAMEQGTRAQLVEQYKEGTRVFAEALEGVDPGVVTIAPLDLDRVTTDGLNRLGSHVPGHAIGRQDRFTAPLVDAMGAATGQTQRPHVDQAPGPVGPVDDEGPRVVLLDPGGQVGIGLGHGEESRDSCRFGRAAHAVARFRG